MESPEGQLIWLGKGDSRDQLGACGPEDLQQSTRPRGERPGPLAAGTRLNEKNAGKPGPKEHVMRYICANCGYIYDPANGDPEAGVAAGTDFGELPDDWICPVCYQPRSVFDPLD